MGFAVKCFNILAWPLFSLGYPLCASIRAIETNSDSDVQKLVTYWVCFSIISLFDHAFGKLLQWFPLWNYVKLLAICWLVMPHFDGSLYVYKHFIHPCFLVTPEFVINRFNRWKEYLLPKERFLVAAEKYIEENGAEALENLIAKKLQSKFTKPNLDVEEVKAVASKEKNVESSKFAEPNLDVIEVKAVAVAADKHVESFAKPNLDVKEVKAVATSEKNVELSKGKEPTASQKEMKTLEITEKKEVAAAKWVNKTEIIFSQTENKMCAPPAIKGITAPGRENKLPEMPIPMKSQKEWTCALCQVTTTGESDLNSHLQGRRHREAYEELKAQNKAAKNKGSMTSKTKDYDQPTAEPKKHKKQEGKVEAIKIDGQRCMKPKESGVDMKDSAFWCCICNIKCSGDKQMAAHRNGSKHLARVREHYAL